MVCGLLDHRVCIDVSLNIFLYIPHFQASLKCSNDKSAIIEDVYSCIRANAQQLSQFPELFPQLCLNEPDISYCATMTKVRYTAIYVLYIRYFKLSVTCFGGPTLEYTLHIIKMRFPLKLPAISVWLNQCQYLNKCPMPFSPTRHLRTLTCYQQKIINSSYSLGYHLAIAGSGEG